MGNLSMTEVFVVLVVALIVLGPTRLPQAARQVGRAMAEFRRISAGFQAELRDVISDVDVPPSAETPPAGHKLPSSPDDAELPAPGTDDAAT